MLRWKDRRWNEIIVYRRATWTNVGETGEYHMRASLTGISVDSTTHSVGVEVLSVMSS